MAFTSDTIIGAAPLQIQFTDNTVGFVVGWYWQFGDGETSTEQSPIHIYTGEGRYTVTLEVTYADTTTDTFTETGYILVDEVILDAERKCLRYATEQTEGQGWSEYGGDSMVIPIGDNGVFVIEDDDEQQRNIVIDKYDYGIYETDTCDRYINNKPSPLDKGIDEIAWEKHERENVLDETEENKRIKHESSHIGIRPADTTNRGKSGYSASGQRSLQEITIEAYSDGEKITPTAIAPKVIEDGEVTFTSMNVNACRVQMVVRGTCGEIEVANTVHKFLGIAQGSPEPEKRRPGNYNTIMELTTSKVVWLSRGLIPLKNRCTGVTLSGGTVTAIAGPDGRESGFTCTGDVILDNATIVANCTIMLWSKDTNLFAGVTGWSTYGAAVGGWTLHHKYSGGILSGLVMLAGSKCDVRVYSKMVSPSAIKELYDDMVLFEGKKVMPI